MPDEFEHGHHHFQPEPGHHHADPYLHGGLFPYEHPWDYPYYAGFARHCAEHCDDQLPLFSQVGRGLQGDGYLVRVVYDDETRETYLEGLLEDAHTGARTHDWYSHNVNGGKLTLERHYFPLTDPQTFSLRFILDRPDYSDGYSQGNRVQKGWELETPMIPFIWDTPADAPLMGVASFFLKKKGAPAWKNVDLSTTPHTIAQTKNIVEKLVYPEGNRDDFRAPKPGDKWTVNLEYGIGGDLDVPNSDDLAKILGVTPDSLEDIVENRDVPDEDTFGTNPDGSPKNVKEYIDDRDTQVEQKFKTHLHQDLFGGDGSATYREIQALGLAPLKGDPQGAKSVWDWIKYAIGDAVGKAENHLHDDLFGGEGSPTYNKIARLGLAPLKGDPQGTKSVWDWIEYVMGNISDPVLRSLDLKTALGNQSVYLVLYKPDGNDSKVIPKTIEAADARAAIQADISIQYYDVLPTIAVAVTPKKTGLQGYSPQAGTEGKTTYYGWDHKSQNNEDWVDYVLLGTGEVLVICTKSGSDYKPVDLKQINLPSRVVAGTVQYPKMNPENLSNTGFGWICADGDLYTVYPDATRPTFNDQNELTNDPDTAVLSVNGSSFGDWEVYTGIGNFLQKSSENSLRGGWPWATESEVNSAMGTGYSTGSYGYLFNRSIGNLGTRVHIDYARTYTLTYN